MAAYAVAAPAEGDAKVMERAGLEIKRLELYSLFERWGFRVEGAQAPSGEDSAAFAKKPVVSLKDIELMLSSTPIEKVLESYDTLINKIKLSQKAIAENAYLLMRGFEALMGSYQILQRESMREDDKGPHIDNDWIAANAYLLNIPESRMNVRLRKFSQMSMQERRRIIRNDPVIMMAVGSDADVQAEERMNGADK